MIADRQVSGELAQLGSVPESFRVIAVVNDAFFRARLDSMIEVRRLWVVSEAKLPWTAIEATLLPKFAHAD